MVAIPIVALIVASTMSAGGINGMLMVIDGLIRTTLNAIVDFVRALS